MPGQPANARIVGQGLRLRKTNGDTVAFSLECADLSAL